MTADDMLNTEEQNRKQGAPRGQKRPFRPREIWAIRARLEMLGSKAHRAGKSVRFGQEKSGPFELGSKYSVRSVIWPC